MSSLWAHAYENIKEPKLRAKVRLAHIWDLEQDRVVNWNKDYHAARRHHAWLLRSEGLTYAAIGVRLGLHGERIRQIIFQEGRRITGSLRKSKARWTWL